MRKLCYWLLPFLLLKSAAAFSQCDTIDLALGRPAFTSSIEGNDTAAFTPTNAFDGDTTTRWSSASADPQYIFVDLGAVYNLCRVTLFWENAYGSNFTIDVSNDSVNWTSLATITGNTALKDTIPLSGSGRYVRMSGTVRGTPFGYSLYEFQVFGFPAGCSPTNLALGQPVTASSVEGGLAPSNAVDGDITTRWGSAFLDSQYIYVDLGSVHNLCQVALYWEAAYASSFNIDVSNDAASWMTIDSMRGNYSRTNILNVTGSGRYVRMFGLSRATSFGFSLFEFQVRDQPVTLPVGLIDWTATDEGNRSVLLRWTTAQEVNNRYFGVERSADAVHFLTIGQVAGAGTSSTPLNYQWTDSVPAKGTNYYRLRQVDLDGKFSYSTVVTAYISTVTGSRLAVFPNPAGDVIHILNPDGLQIREVRIYDASGAELRRYGPFADSNAIQLTIGGLSSGLYTLKVITDTGTEALKLMH
jgi:F5/8 type C domain/Secretion system C-terminal sorting domain